MSPWLKLVATEFGTFPANEVVPRDCKRKVPVAPRFFDEHPLAQPVGSVCCDRRRPGGTDPTPSAVVISDKPIAHDTQRTVPDYRRLARDRGARVRTTGKDRHVLTTRRDGSILFTVNVAGDYSIDTEIGG